MIVDVSSFQRGVDAYTDPELLAKTGFCSSAVNRSFRGSINGPRPSFQYINARFDDTDTENLFKTRSVSGVFAYRKKSSKVSPYLIVAVGNRILAGRVYSNYVEFKTIYIGISQQWEHSFFCQAETILVWQNGYDEPLYWEGDINTMMKPCSDAIAGVSGATQMPIGNIMCYAHGRIFLANVDNLVFASNHIYSAGAENLAKGVLNFSESTYPFAGDGFGTPGDLDEVTGISVVKQNPQPNGHGPVVVFCRNGAYSIAADVPRSSWTQERAIQTVALTGRGCIAHNSVTQVNSDIWYRCSDGNISSFRYTSNDQANSWSDTSLSREVQRYLKYDSDITREFSSSLFFNNRLIVTVAHEKQEGEDGETHRFANGMVVADFDRGSTVVKDDPLSWEGLWTGPRTTGCCKLYTDGIERAFFFSFDKDNQNRIYELTDTIGDDLLSSGPSPIEGIHMNSFFFADSDRFLHKRIDSAVVMYDNASENSEIDIYYSPDYQSCFYKMISKPGQMPLQAPETTENTGNVFGRKSFRVDCNTDHAPGIAKSSNYGLSFRVIVKSRGTQSIRKMILFANPEHRMNEAEPQSDFICWESWKGNNCIHEDSEIFNYQF